MTHLRLFCFLISFATTDVMMGGHFACAQKFVIESRVKMKGEVRAVNDDELTLADAEGRVFVCKIQRTGKRAVSIDGKFLRSSAAIKVTGKLPVSFLIPDMAVKLQASLRKGGRSEGEIHELILIDGDEGDTSSSNSKGTVTEISPPADSKYAQCEVVGIVQQNKKGRLAVLTDDSPYAAKGRVRVQLADDAMVVVDRDDLDLVQAGDVVKSLSAFKLRTGHLVVEAVEVELKNERNAAVMEGVEQAMKYNRLSNADSSARDVRSQHFLLHTDISDREGQMLLDKLETMIELVSQYYRRPSKGLIECYVVRDVKNWPQDTFPENALAKILEPAGVTLTRSLGKQRRTIVFSCDDHRTVQHEAIHAYCQQSFGSTGPVWYSEGMAEMGAYWKQGQLEVDIQPGVINYLTNAPPKKMLDIVAAGQVTGDSWQAYAWRWALCHLLANNPNYSDRLKGLGVAMMSGRKASFEATYGDVAENISFEYDQFVKNFGNGYRADLSAWQWNVKARKLSRKPATVNVQARLGWQATGVLVEQAESYDVAAEGTWQITEAGETLSASGNATGGGKLIGAIFKDFKLSKPFELGDKTSFAASQDGHLFLRCQDAWTELSENSGELKISIKHTQAP